MIFLLISLSTKGLLFFLSKIIVIGTPQDLCLDTHQSGRSSIIDFILFLLDGGYHFTSSIESRAVALRFFSVIEINHCEVVLYINGALDLHE